MPRRQQTHDGGNVLLARNGGLDVNHYVGLRQHHGDRGLDLVGDVVRPLERRAAADGERDVGEDFRPAAAHSQSSDVLDAGDLPGGGENLLLQFRRHGVQQIIDRLLAELHADPNDDYRHAEGGHRVGLF